MASRPKLDLTTLGTTGLPVWSGRVYDEMLRELDGERGRKIFREMSEQDPIVGGTLLGIEMLARQVSWSLKPASLDEEEDNKPPPAPINPLMPPEPPEPSPKKKKAIEVAEFVDGALSDMSPTYGGALSEILSMLVYGWSWLEIIYKRRDGLNVDDPMKNSLFEDGKVGWGGWSIRSQESLFGWEFDNDRSLVKNTGNITAMHQQGPPDWAMHIIPRSKSLHFKTRSRRQNPEGISLLRNAYRPWYMKNNIEVIEGIGIERDLAGLPVLWAPSELFSMEADAEQKALFATLQKIVTSIKRDEQEGILMPMAYDEEGKNPLYKLELLSTGGDRQFDTSGVINRYDERIAMSMLADFILMGHSQVGSFALSTTKTGLFSMALSAILDVITEEINTQAIPKLVVLNGWTLDMVPTLMHGKVEAADVSKIGEFLNQLSGAGMKVFPNKTLETYVLELAGLPGSQEIEDAANLPPGQFDPFTGEPIVPQLSPGAPNTPPVPPAAGVTKVPAPSPARARPPRAVALQREVARAAAEPTDDEGGEVIEEDDDTGDTVQAHVGKTHHRHFIPLPVRVAKVRAYLEKNMEPNDYRELLAEVMAYGKFTKLKPAYREAILLGEVAAAQA